MSKQNNIIQRLSLELNVPSQKIVGETEKTISQIIKDKLIRSIDKIIDKYDNPNETIIIDKLVIDVGNISFEKLNNIFENKFTELFEKLLKESLGERQASIKADKRSSINSELEAFKMFLTKGHFPWWYDASDIFDFKQLISRLLSKTRSNFIYLIVSLDERGIDRLAKQLEIPLIKKVVKALISNIDGQIFKKLEKILKTVSKSYKTYKIQRKYIYERLLKRLAIAEVVAGISTYEIIEILIEEISSEMQSTKEKLTTDLLVRKYFDTYTPELKSDIKKVYKKIKKQISTDSSYKDLVYFDIDEELSIENYAESKRIFSLDLFPIRFLADIIKHFLMYKDFPAWSENFVSRVKSENEIFGIDDSDTAFLIIIIRYFLSHPDDKIKDEIIKLVENPNIASSVSVLSNKTLVVFVAWLTDSSTDIVLLIQELSMLIGKLYKAKAPTNIIQHKLKQFAIENITLLKDLSPLHIVEIFVNHIHKLTASKATSVLALVADNLEKIHALKSVDTKYLKEKRWKTEDILQDEIIKEQFVICKQQNIDIVVFISEFAKVIETNSEINISAILIAQKLKQFIIDNLHIIKDANLMQLTELFLQHLHHKLNIEYNNLLFTIAQNLSKISAVKHISIDYIIKTKQPSDFLRDDILCEQYKYYSETNIDIIRFIAELSSIIKSNVRISISDSSIQLKLKQFVIENINILKNVKPLSLAEMFVYHLKDVIQIKVYMLLHLISDNLIEISELKSVNIESAKARWQNDKKFNDNIFKEHFDLISDIKINIEILIAELSEIVIRIPKVNISVNMVKQRLNQFVIKHISKFKNCDALQIIELLLPELNIITQQHTSIILNNLFESISFISSIRKSDIIELREERWKYPDNLHDKALKTILSDFLIQKFDIVVLITELACVIANNKFVKTSEKNIIKLLKQYVLVNYTDIKYDTPKEIIKKLVSSIAAHLKIKENILVTYLSENISQISAITETEFVKALSDKIDYKKITAQNKTLSTKEIDDTLEYFLSSGTLPVGSNIITKEMLIEYYNLFVDRYKTDKLKIQQLFSTDKSVEIFISIFPKKAIKNTLKTISDAYYETAIQLNKEIELFVLEVSKLLEIEIELIQSIEKSSLIQEIKKIKSIKGIEQSRLIDEIKKSKSIQETEKNRLIQEIEKIKSLQDIEQVRLIQTIKKSKSIQDTEKSRLVEAIKKIKSIQDTEKGILIEAIKNSKSIQNTEKSRLIQEIKQSKSIQEIEKNRSLKRSKLKKLKATIDQFSKQRITVMLERIIIQLFVEFKPEYQTKSVYIETFIKELSKNHFKINDEALLVYINSKIRNNKEGEIKLLLSFVNNLDNLKHKLSELSESNIKFLEQENIEKIIEHVTVKKTEKDTVKKTEKDTVKVISKYDTTETLIFFLIHGYLPWWSSLTSIIQIENKIKKTFEITYAQKQQLKKILQNKIIRHRFLIKLKLKTRKVVLNNILDKSFVIYFTLIDKITKILQNYIIKDLNIVKVVNVLYDYNIYILFSGTSVSPQSIIKQILELASKTHVYSYEEVLRQFHVLFQENKIVSGEEVELLKIFLKEEFERIKSNKSTDSNLDVPTIEEAIKDNNVLDFLEEQGVEDAYINLINEKCDWVDTQDTVDKIYIENSGVVILWPLYSILFTRTGLFKSRKFKDKASREKGVHLLYYLATGLENPSEHLLALNKVLCGLEVSEPIAKEIEITDLDKTECENLIKAAMQQWPMMESTSVEGFRETFIAREGALYKKARDWNLKVEEKTVDILMKKMPWGLGMVKFSWNDYIIYVEWNY